MGHAADVDSDLDDSPLGPGLKAIAKGFQDLFGRDDHRKLERAPLYDALYDYFQRQPTERREGNGMLWRIGDVSVEEPGAFDHADVCLTTGQVFVAHTAQDCIEHIDGVTVTRIQSIPGCVAGSGVLYAPEPQWMLVAARGAGQLLVLDATTGVLQRTVSVGPKPNGLAWDPTRQRALVADVATQDARCIDPARGRTVATATLPGRPRWCVYDPARDCYWVNMQAPALVQGLSGSDLTPVAALPTKISGPHGLALDPAQDRLFVACDAAQLVVLALASGTVVATTSLAGPPDVVWLNEPRGLLYVGIGDPGCVQVVDTTSYRVIEEIPTEPGAHTLTFDAVRQRLYVFLPQTGHVAVYREASDAEGSRA